MSGIKLRVLSTLLRHGQRIETGSILTVPATEAADYLDGPKVALLDPADRQVVLAARRAEVSALMRTHGRPRPDPGSPWQPVDYLQ